MKRSTNLVVMVLTVLSSAVAWAVPVGTQFSYQGQLSGAAGPVSASCDLRFRLFDAESVGTQQGPEVTRAAHTIASGLFTVGLDFGIAFAGERRWLEVDVRCPAGAGAYTTLPRQEITPSPYSLTSLSTIALQGRPVSADAPASGDVLGWDGTQWSPAPPDVDDGTPANTPNTGVARDAAGGFAATTIALEQGPSTAALTLPNGMAIWSDGRGSVNIEHLGTVAADFGTLESFVNGPLTVSDGIQQSSGNLELAPNGRINQNSLQLIFRSEDRNHLIVGDFLDQNVYLASGRDPSDLDVIRIGERKRSAYLGGVYGADRVHDHSVGEYDPVSRQVVSVDQDGQLSGWTPKIVTGPLQPALSLEAEALVFCPHAFVLGCSCIAQNGITSQSAAVEVPGPGGHTLRGCHCRMRPDPLEAARVAAQAICLEPGF